MKARLQIDPRGFAIPGFQKSRLIQEKPRVIRGEYQKLVSPRLVHRQIPRPLNLEGWKITDGEVIPEGKI